MLIRAIVYEIRFTLGSMTMCLFLCHEKSLVKNAKDQWKPYKRSMSRAEKMLNMI
jgi:hypothetical protein